MSKSQPHAVVVVKRHVANLPNLVDIEFGNLNKLDTKNTGWFIGYSDWTKSGEQNLRYMPFDQASKGLCVKWCSHEPGNPNGECKPLSEGRTISILMTGQSEFRIDFSLSDTFEDKLTTPYSLKNVGDYVIWGAKIYHRAFCIELCNILTIRWEPEV